MPRPDNYAIMADHARLRFLTYDQAEIIAKSPVRSDENHIFLPVLDLKSRIDRSTGAVDWSSDGLHWAPAPRPLDALVVYDYLCDSKPGRALQGEFMAMANFGHMFHSGLLEDGPASPLERFIDENPDAFQAACIQLGGTPFPKGDAAFVVNLFPDLPVAVQFWHADEDFPPALRYLWDKNSLSYLRYETMYYALAILRDRLRDLMKAP